jgi:hypothetical protein
MKKRLKKKVFTSSNPTKEYKIKKKFNIYTPDPMSPVKRRQKLIDNLGDRGSEDTDSSQFLEDVLGSESGDTAFHLGVI